MNRKLYSFYIDSPKRDELQALSDQTDVTVSEHIRKALEEYAPLRGMFLSGATVLLNPLFTSSGCIGGMNG